MSILHKCSRCATPYTAEEWARLPYVGRMDDGEGGFLSLRNCPCGGTMVVHAKDDPAASTSEEIAA